MLGKIGLSIGVFACIAALVLCEAQTKSMAQNSHQSSAIYGFGSKELAGLKGAVSSDKKYLTIEPADVSKKGKGRDIFIIGPKFFKPNTDYILEFTYKTTHTPNIDSYLGLFVTGGDKPHTNHKQLRRCLLESSKDPRKIRYGFNTGSDAYCRLILRAFGGVSAQLSNFSLREGTAQKFVGITADYDTIKSPLPEVTGSKEFTVMAPETDGRPVVKAADFGLSQASPDNFKALAKALEHCKKVGAGKLVIDNGIYNFTTNKSIEFEGLNNLEIECNGATFLFLKSNERNMQISNCKRLKIVNLNIDWNWQKMPLAEIVQVMGTKFDGPNSYADIKFLDYEDYPVKDFYTGGFVPYDIKNKRIGLESANSNMFNMGTGSPGYKLKLQWLSGNTVRMTMLERKARQFECKYYRFQHAYYHQGCMAIDSSEHTTLKNVNIYSCCGQAIVVTGTTKYLWLDTVNITVPKGDKKRVISATADHFIMARSSGFIKIENCDFGFGSDDCVNVHDNTMFASRRSDKSIKPLSNRNSYIFEVGEEIELLNSDYTKTGYVGKVVAHKLNGEKDKVPEVVFDKPLPPLKTEGYIALNTKYGTRNVIFRNCKFHNNRARGVLILARDVTIENCYFYGNEMGAIKLETGYTMTLWCEGYGVDNVLIRNNVFDSCNIRGNTNFGIEREIYIGAYARNDPSEVMLDEPIIKNVRFENNVFKNAYGALAVISSAKNVSFVGNEIINTLPRKAKRDYRGGFFVMNSKNILIEDNTYIDSPLINPDKIGVVTNEPGSLAVRGNKIVKQK